VLLAGGAADAPELRAAAAELRARVFVGEQGVDPAIEADALDDAPGTTHAVALDADGRVVGTGRLVDPGGVPAAGRVGRMAVAPGARGRGVGLAVLRPLEGASRDRGLVAVELHAQAHAQPFYARAGYAPYGPRFSEQGIPHVAMRREWLPGLRPAADADAEAVQTLIGDCWAEFPGCVLDVDAEEPWMRAPASRFGGVLLVADGVRACVGVKGSELKSLYVAKPRRGQGFGTVLVRLAERAGATSLWSDSRFTDAHRLYERLGWRRTGSERELHDLSATVEWQFVRQDPQQQR